MDFGFGVGYSELFVLAIIAVVVIGPKDLPVVLRKYGQLMQKIRGLSREFQSHVDVAMKDSGVAEIKKELQSAQTAVNNSVKSPAMQGSNALIDSMKRTDYKTYFGDGVGETSVAGSAVSPS